MSETKPNDSANGLTIREYFAIQALQGLFADASTETLSTDKMCKYAVDAADALIVELNRSAE